MPEYEVTDTGVGLGQIFASTPIKTDSIGAAVMRLLRTATDSIDIILDKTGSGWDVSTLEVDPASVDSTKAITYVATKAISGRSTYDWVSTVSSDNLFVDAGPHSLLAALNGIDSNSTKIDVSGEFSTAGLSLPFPSDHSIILEQGTLETGRLSISQSIYADASIGVTGSAKVLVASFSAGGGATWEA